MGLTSQGAFMKKNICLVLCFLFLYTAAVGRNITSLSQLFRLDYGLLDTDQDSLAERIGLRIILPDSPTPAEIAVAGNIAARANFETLGLDLNLVQKESSVSDWNALPNVILIGGRQRILQRWAQQDRWRFPEPAEEDGFVHLLSRPNGSAIVLCGGSSESLLQTGQAFFLRWPYLWDIWGREEGITYSRVEKDLQDVLEKEGITGGPAVFRRLHYRFPSLKTPHDALKQLRFTSGEIRELQAFLEFSDPEAQTAAAHAFERLRLDQRKGRRTGLLNYPGCALISIEIRGPSQSQTVSIPRLGYPKRMLTPGYRSVSNPNIPEHTFDLLTLLGPGGLYTDSDGDRIPDHLNTTLILAENDVPTASASFASRLVLHTAGASFPLLFMPNEIEEPDQLKNPIFIGRSELTERLIQTGRLKVPELGKGWGMARIVPGALNKSTGLAFIGADAEGLENVLNYFSRSYPYFDRYGAGEPTINLIPEAVNEFVQGKRGGAEAGLFLELESFLKTLEDKTLDSLSLQIHTPGKNTAYGEWLSAYLEEKTGLKKPEVDVFSTEESRVVFEKNEEFPWEGNDVFNLIKDKTSILKKAAAPLSISIGISESPAVRQALASDIRAYLTDEGIKKYDLEVLCSYKQGFFWLTERVAPALRGKEITKILIRFAKENDELSKAKRFYSEPFRWLQELYPVDDVLSGDLGIPLENIMFEIMEEPGSVYEINAFNSRDQVVFRDTFSPTTRTAPYLSLLPEWGDVKLTTGWLRIRSGDKPLTEIAVPSDLELFWEYYQDEILTAVNSYIMEKTGARPTFDKQPYFKRLLVEMWFSEPDFKLGVDEEVVSSLESIHDELYFDTLDFIRGITHVEIKDKETEEDTSRYSAPGNILPLIHPSTEGKKGRVRVAFEDWRARKPEMRIEWKESGKKPQTKTITFSELPLKDLTAPSLIYNGPQERIEEIRLDIPCKNEKTYLHLIDLLSAYRKLQKADVVPALFSAPRLFSVRLHLNHEKLEKDEVMTVASSAGPEKKITSPDKKQAEFQVPTTEIISPDACLDLVEKIGAMGVVQTHIAGTSFEGRRIPVMEAFSPASPYVSLPRLITFKPTLYLSGRQHANEVSSTNYILKFAELLSTDPAYREYLRKMNVVLHPLENPDGAALAFQLQKITPFHSLHAGRYTALGIDVGYQVGSEKPLLPEAKVRRNLYDKWLPDIYLNLHGYPSHEWVQQFSNYSPYLFRDYWIPRGWFAYFRSLSLPIYRTYSREGANVRDWIVKEMNANVKIKASNQKLYDRYDRWAARWQPHMNYLELYNGLNLYAKRRSSRESTLDARSRITYVEETPEVMDETAQGEWLDFICEQGLTYIMAHVKYLNQVIFPIERIEEEIEGRIFIRFVRGRPGDSTDSEGKR